MKSLRTDSVAKFVKICKQGSSPNLQESGKSSGDSVEIQDGADGSASPSLWLCKVWCSV